MTTKITALGSVLVKCLQKQNITVYRNRKMHSLECKCDFEIDEIIQSQVTTAGGKVLTTTCFLVPDTLDGRKMIKSIDSFIEYRKSYIQSVSIRNQCHFNQNIMNGIYNALSYYSMINGKQDFYGCMTANFDKNGYITLCHTGSKSVIGKLNLSCSFLQVIKKRKVLSSHILFNPIIKTLDEQLEDLPF